MIGVFEQLKRYSKGKILRDLNYPDSIWICLDCEVVRSVSCRDGTHTRKTSRTSTSARNKIPYTSTQSRSSGSGTRTGLAGLTPGLSRSMSSSCVECTRTLAGCSSDVASNTVSTSTSSQASTCVLPITSTTYGSISISGSQRSH